MLTREISFYIFLFVSLLTISSFSSKENNGVFTLVDDFEENISLGRDLSVIVVGKDYHQGKRHQIELKQGKRDDNEIPSTKTPPAKILKGFSSGGVSPEKGIKMNSRGVVLGVSLDQEEITISNSRWKKHHFLPYSLSFHETKMLISGWVYIEEFDLEKGTKRKFTNKWFKGLHSAEYNHDGTKCLLTSTGYDTIFEMDLTNGELTWEWNAWENGYEMSPWGFRTTRDPIIAEDWKRKYGDWFIYVDPLHPSFFYGGLIKKARPCHLNSATYLSSDEQTIGFSCLHLNTSFIITKNNLEPVVAYDQSYGPHGFDLQKRNVPCKGYLITSTRDDNILFLDESLEVCERISFHGLKKINEENESEDISENNQDWLQYVRHLENDLYVAVDCKRTQLVLFDVSSREYRRIPYPKLLSVHDVVLEPSEVSSLLPAFFEHQLGMRREERKKEVNKRNGKSIRMFGMMKHREVMRIKELNEVVIQEREMEEFMNICNGEYFPQLNGFMNEEDYLCVLEEGTLCDGSIFWNPEDEDDDDTSLPYYKKKGRRVISKLVAKSELPNLQIGDEIALVRLVRSKTSQKSKKHGKKGEQDAPMKKIVGSMRLESLFPHEADFHSFQMYGKSIKNPNKKESRKNEIYHFHEGVKSVYGSGKYFLGGEVTSCLI